MRLGRESGPGRDMGGGHAGRVVGPGLGQVQRPIDEGVATAGHVRREHADLAVGDLAGRARVLAGHPAGRLALLEKASLVNHQHGIRLGQGLDHVVPHEVTQRVGIPAATAEDRLLTPRTWVACRLGAHPAGLAPLRPEQPVEECRSKGRHTGTTEQGLDLGLDRAQFGRPEIQRLFDRGTRHRQLPPSWKGSDGTAQLQL